MLKFMASLLRPVLDFPLVLRLRRNHGLEHGTIHLLNRQRYTASGVSSLTGFVLLGDVPTEKVTRAVEDALRRFRKGEAALALHPNCGTNLVVTAALMTAIGAVGFVGTDRRAAWDRLSVVLFAMTLAAMFSLPLGMSVQKHFTTCGEMGGLELLQITRRELTLGGRRVVLHHVRTG